MRGMSVAHTWQQGGRNGYGTPTSRATLEALRALEVTWISLTPFGFQESLRADAVQLVTAHSAGESDDRLRREIEAAHAVGLKVLLKPHLWIERGEWSGQIDPGSPEAWAHWFESYRRFMMHYAALAQQTGCEMLTVGVELGSSSRAWPDHWRSLVAELRKVYAGPLVYAANWDEAYDIPWWNAVDYIGVQFYGPLTDHLEASPSELSRGLKAHLDRYDALATREGRPLLFTEVGYKSIRATAVRPHVWPEQLTSRDRVPSEQAQALAYRVFLEAIRDRRQVAGLFWWKWFTDPNTDEEGRDGFSPRGKQAEGLLRAAFRGECLERAVAAP